MELKDITEENIEDIADSDSILERGRRYYRAGKVIYLDVKDGIIILNQKSL